MRFGNLLAINQKKKTTWGFQPVDIVPSYAKEIENQKNHFRAPSRSV
jgi:hypothetical protein